ncbi:hypothetical protein HYFRA_00010777 [Hymenoscyphus fraxineus]|uniref:Uncharacterized protein n=1 Tax=Hymenoscyphus fraxineus TaxID=746836 RepID=A0A9N9PRW2_9HELO|nr:hypothetical protein HYFRA_00010777 [Hymenoscyphus fraxineus]
MTYSCVILCAAPQAPEKTVKTRSEVKRSDFRPKISLNFAQIIRRPREIIVRQFMTLVSSHTGVFICNSYQRGADDRYLQIREKQSDANTCLDISEVQSESMNRPTRL